MNKSSLNSGYLSTQSTPSNMVRVLNGTPKMPRNAEKTRNESQDPVFMPATLHNVREYAKTRLVNESSPKLAQLKRVTRFDPPWQYPVSMNGLIDTGERRLQRHQPIDT